MSLVILINSKRAIFYHPAMNIFHELSLCLPSQVHTKDMTSIFENMYCGRYPSPELLSILPDRQSYISEPLSILENIIFIFQNLSVDNQCLYLQRLQPYIPF